MAIYERGKIVNSREQYICPDCNKKYPKHREVWENSYQVIMSPSLRTKIDRVYTCDWCDAVIKDYKR
jgi:hypothetical protein